MDINLILVLIQSLTSIIALVSILILYRTIKSNEDINQRTIFNEVVKQERELRIKLSEYREEIHKRQKKSKDKENFIEITLDYDTLLFNYYEYLAICVNQRLINEKETKLYFKDLLIEVKDRFENSLLFKERYAEKSQYKVLQWLFKKWEV